MFRSNQPLVAQQRPRDTADEEREDECHGEAEARVFHAVDEVHAEETGHEHGQGEHDGDRRERAHHGVHVVVDDARVGVHGRFEDVRVDGGGFAGLRHLDVHVFDEVVVEFIDLELELELLQQVLVASDGGLEVGERVLQAREPDEAFVVHRVVEVVLGLVDEGVDLLESLQVPHGGGEEQPERQIDVVDEACAALLVEADEVEHHVRLVEADGDGDVALVDDAERHGGVGRARADFLDVGDAQDDEHPSVVVLVAGALVGVADVVDEIVGNLESFFEFALVFFCRTGHLNPTVRFPLLQVRQFAGCVPVSLHCANPLFLIGNLMIDNS